MIRYINMIGEKKRAQAKQGLHFTFRGDREILPLLNLKLELTIIVQKPFVTSIPIVPLFPETESRGDCILEPVIGIEVFGQSQKEALVKNRSLLKDSTLYIYFPSNIRVDEKVNKIYSSSYENLLKEIPRNMRNNFVKLVLCDHGSGENSVEGQRNRCSDALGLLFKVHLQRRIEGYIGEINAISYNELSLKNLQVLFRNKLSLAQFYRRMGVDEKSEEMLELVWQDMLYNQRFFVEGALKFRETAYLPPFIERSYPQLLKDFNNPDCFLRVCGFAFFRCFEMQLELMNYCEAMRNLKKFIEFSYSNVFNGIKTRPDLVKNLWMMSVIDESYEIAQRLGRTYPTFLNPQREAEYHTLAVHIAKTYRNAIEQAGAILYAFNHLNSFPRTLEVEVDQSLQHLAKINERVVSEGIEDSKLISGKVDENLLLLFGGLESFRLLYLKSLINLYELLNRSGSHKRNARGVKLIVLKIYLTAVQPPNLEFSQQYLSKLSAGRCDVYGYIEKILSKAEKYTLLDEEDGYINDTVFKRSLRYSVEKDNFINRNREDENLWPQLKFLEDYYKFIILLISYRRDQLAEQHKEDNPLNLSFSKSLHRIPVKTDNIIHLLLNQDLMRLESKWETTVSLVREIFLLEKAEEGRVDEKSPVGIRMGILLDARIAENDEKLVIRVNNTQLLNLLYLPEHSLISLELEITDVNKVTKVIKLRLIDIRVLPDEIMELEFAVLHEECLIFIIRELRVRIGLLLCYYVNKSLEVEEIKALEEEERRAQKKKKSRKYSSFQEKLREEEFVHMVNKSDHLALNHLHYHTLTLTPTHVQNIPKAHPSLSFDLRDSSSQSSIYNLVKDKPVTVPLYVDIWTPIFYSIKPNPQSKVGSITLHPHRILTVPSEKEEVSDWIRIDGKWINRCSQDSLRIDLAQSGIELVVMMRCRGIRQLRNNRKARKDSEMSRSAFSSNASWEKGEFLQVQVEIIQDESRYQVESNICYSKNLAFDVKYMYCDDLEEYTFRNAAKIPVHLHAALQVYSLREGEEVRLESPDVEVAVNEDREDGKDGEDAPVFRSTLNLQNYIKKELLRPEELLTCDLRIFNPTNTSFKRLEVIRISSNECGVLSILDAGSGFQLIGKTEGEVQLDKQGNLDLYLLPTKTGRLILPSILIGDRKGIWREEIFLSISE